VNTLLAQEWFTRAAFAVAGLINLLPVAGLLGRSAPDPRFPVRPQLWCCAGALISRSFCVLRRF
jgi:hypothetical protein